MNRRTSTPKGLLPAKETSGERSQAPASALPAPPITVDGDRRRQSIAVEAYFLAERRGFAPGGELDDWLAAETIVEARLCGSNARDSSDASSSKRAGEQ